MSLGKRRLESKNLLHALQQREITHVEQRIRQNVSVRESVLTVADARHIFNFQEERNKVEGVTFSFRVYDNIGIITFQMQVQDGLLGAYWNSRRVFCLDVDSVRLEELRRNGKADEEIFTVYTREFYSALNELESWRHL